MVVAQMARPVLALLPVPAVVVAAVADLPLVVVAAALPLAVLVVAEVASLDPVARLPGRPRTQPRSPSGRSLPTAYPHL